MEDIRAPVVEKAVPLRAILYEFEQSQVRAFKRLKQGLLAHGL